MIDCMKSNGDLCSRNWLNRPMILNDSSYLLDEDSNYTVIDSNPLLHLALGAKLAKNECQSLLLEKAYLPE